MHVTIRMILMFLRSYGDASCAAPDRTISLPPDTPITLLRLHVKGTTKNLSFICSYQHMRCRCAFIGRQDKQIPHRISMAYTARFLTAS